MTFFWKVCEKFPVKNTFFSCALVVGGEGFLHLLCAYFSWHIFRLTYSFQARDSEDSEEPCGRHKESCGGCTRNIREVRFICSERSQENEKSTLVENVKLGTMALGSKEHRGAGESGYPPGYLLMCKWFRGIVMALGSEGNEAKVREGLLLNFALLFYCNSQIYLKEKL